jgi:hypothetical protein
VLWRELVIHQRDQARRIERLLEDLRGARVVRRDLLWQLIDELDDARPHSRAAAAAARGLLVLVEAGRSDDEDIGFELDRIARLVGLATPPRALSA